MRDKWNALTSWRTQTDGQMSQDTERIRTFVAIVILVIVIIVVVVVVVVVVVIVVRQRERDKSRWEGKDPSERGTLTSWRAWMDEQVWDQCV